MIAGNIIEENHYYSYGLRIAAISSKKLGNSNEGKLGNSYLYNEKEMLDEDADLGWYDYGFRNYDPQIGRFPQHDPLTFEYPYYTPYQYAGCEPITNVDVDGLEPANTVVSFANNSVMPNIIITSTVKNAATAGSIASGAVRAAVIGGLRVTESVAQTSQLKNQLNRYGVSRSSEFPTMSQTRPEKISGWQAGLMFMKMSYPIVYDIINSPIVGAKTLGSGPFGYSKSDVRGIGGEETTADERYMGGVSFLTLFVPAVGAEMSATKGVSRSLNNLKSLKGATWEEIEHLIPRDWIKGPLKKGEGIKYVNPNKKGEQILLEKGWPGTKDPLHSGPYMKISRNGNVDRIPLEGNPVLK